MSSVRGSLLAAAAVAAAAFLLYRATLLPGQDLGDTASFQATVGEPAITPRQAYPLYYATGNLFVTAMPGNVARAINTASAFFGALGCGLLALVVGMLTGWAVAGLAAGLLLAVSYTFWSQAIIAEVYALHVFMMGLCFLALVVWARRPSMPRLALFFAVYAIGFGNHLQMILLLPGFALFLVLVAPGGALSMIRPRVVVLAVAMAVLGASQYAWNLRALMTVAGRDPSPVEQLRTFWFDVTKADWRATMVMGIPEGAFRDRVAMYWFDLRQQFGGIGVALAVIGLITMLAPRRLSRQRSDEPRTWMSQVSRWRVGLALLVVFLVNWLFAFTYNVGDAHVFYLPSHFVVALFAGLGAGTILTLAGTRRTSVALAIGAVLTLYPAWRAYDTFPALDRSNDRRITRFFDRLTAGLDHDRDVFAADLNWQLHNGLDYYAKYDRPDLGVADTTGVLLHFPQLVASNRDIGRCVAVSDGSRPLLVAAYGQLFDIERDVRVGAPPFSERIGRFKTGTPYVLTVLAPYADLPVDRDDLSAALKRLTGGTTASPPNTRYNVIAGRVGSKPDLARFDNRPFRVHARVGADDVDIRIECWLPADTIRRMGFGRVIVGRTPALTLDRGASFVALGGAGAAPAVEYGWAILAPQPRWIIPLGSPGMAGLPVPSP